MSNPLHDMIDHIVDPENKWNSEKYRVHKTHSGVTETGIDYNFTYTYQLGTAYMTGVFGSEGVKIEMMYTDNHGFQIKVGYDIAGREPVHFPPHRVQLIKDFFDRWANR